jgi:hypothetical protein
MLLLLLLHLLCCTTSVTCMAHESRFGAAPGVLLIAEACFPSQQKRAAAARGAAATLQPCNHCAHLQGSFMRI